MTAQHSAISPIVREAYAIHLERRAARLERQSDCGVLATMNRRWADMARSGSTNATLRRAQRICGNPQPDLFS